jgi:PKD repeat protein
MTYQWTDGPASNLLDGVGNGEYEVTVSSDNGCVASETYTLEGDGEEPTAGLAEIGTGGVTKNFVNESENAETYEWDFGDGNTSDSENATHTYEEAGTFDVCLTAINDCGEDSECIQVTVTEEDLSTLDQEWTKAIKVFPNPTQDIVNFYVPNIKTGELTILDATGKIVLKNNINSEVTTINVDHLVTGLYMYSITNKENQSVYTQKLSVR